MITQQNNSILGQVFACDGTRYDSRIKALLCPSPSILNLRRIAAYVGWKSIMARNGEVQMKEQNYECTKLSKFVVMTKILSWKQVFINLYGVIVSQSKAPDIVISDSKSH